MKSHRKRPNPTELMLPARQKRTEASRDRILEAAQKEFAQHGFTGATVIDIARAAECSVGSFYRRFRDKEALFFALQEEMYQTESANIERFFGNPKRQSESVDVILRKLVLNTYRGMDKMSGYFRAFVELTRRNVMVWERMTKLEEQQGHLLAKLFEARGVATMSDEVVQKAHLATRAVNAFLITYVLYQPEQFSPEDPLVQDRLAAMFTGFIDVPTEVLKAPLISKN